MTVQLVQFPDTRRIVRGRKFELMIETDVCGYMKWEITFGVPVDPAAIQPMIDDLDARLVRDHKTELSFDRTIEWLHGAVDFYIQPPRVGLRSVPRPLRQIK